MSLSPGIVQGTRGLMLASILLSFISILVESVGLRCTTCMAEEPEQKDKVALAGGVIFLIAGQSPFSSDTHAHAINIHRLKEHFCKMLSFIPRPSNTDASQSVSIPRPRKLKASVAGNETQQSTRLQITPLNIIWHVGSRYFLPHRCCNTLLYVLL